MKTVSVTLKSVSPISFSRYYKVDKLEKESPADFEKRTWRERLHYDESGDVFIPPMALKSCLAEAAKFLSMRIQGKGQATWSKHFQAGVLVTDPIMLGVKKDAVPGEWLLVSSTGTRGGGKSVEKCFPVIQKWSGTTNFLILDESITKDIFSYHLEQAGMLIGLLRFRPRNGGYYGRFAVDQIAWPE